jgi:hypothetical protein
MDVERFFPGYVYLEIQMTPILEYPYLSLDWESFSHNFIEQISYALFYILAPSVTHGFLGLVTYICGTGI